ncbi:MAG: extracellular solute-binding protein [Verrucomicrobia bacterium]|nr:extracellular solute-binding protein [Verrucomicrobiota bacterium]
MRRVFGFMKQYSAFLAIGVTFLWSIIAIAVYRGAESAPDTITLRIGHWQLEASVYDALNEMAAEYQKINPKVRIIQDAIPEMIYGQWTTTQLMGGTAPDILEVGLGVLPYHLWVQYYNRYFVPLTRYVNQPNPYNEGTSLAGVPLRSTFKDGMRNSYIEEMQEYINIPLSQFGVRIFYNKDLLKKLTGRDKAPSEYREFLAVCDEIKQHKDEKGQPYIPIAGSKYHIAMWEFPMFDPLTYSIMRYADFNRDGFVGNDELYVAFTTDRISFTNRAVRARYQMLREVTDNFQTGYTGLTRDEAVFLFAQERAVFMTTGTWDARSLLVQAEGTFEVGVMDFPMPSRDDEYYGEVMEGPNYERLQGGFPFAITRTCKHPEVALDFLLFMAGKEHNEKLNEIIGWIPAVRDTKMPTFLEAFQPHLNGVYGNLNLFLGGETWIRWLQLYTLYQVNQISYDGLAEEFEPFYEKQGIKDYMEQQKDWRRAMQKNEQFLAGIRAKALSTGGDVSASNWIKYRSLTASRQITPEISHSRTMQLLEHGPSLGTLGPYEHSDGVLKRVRENVKRQMKTEAEAQNPSSEDL